MVERSSITGGRPDAPPQKVEGGYVGEGSGGIVFLSPLLVSSDSNVSAYSVPDPGPSTLHPLILFLALPLSLRV